MSTISVQRLRGLEDSPESLVGEIEALQNTIRQTADQFFHNRGGLGASSVDDWIREERQVCWVPQAELKESDTAIYLLIGVPGLGPGEIEITLLPEVVILRGSSLEEEDSQCRVHFSEFGTRKLFRRIPLPSQIHVDSAVVIFDKNMVKLSAAKIERLEDT